MTEPSRNRFFKKARRVLRAATSLHAGSDVGGTIDQIRADVPLRGSQLWLLVCSSLIASIGLDMNSGAVIIGAMLISPLMGPILGVGVGIAILDRSLLKVSIYNLLIATVLSLVVSFLYFLISPLGQLTSELSARTMPTLLDVGVAFFGGVAGIVAGSRKNKSSAIPGVAIATALMPPVCTAGYGLAHFSTEIFGGAIYLYFINAFFISLATYAIALVLRFPKKASVDPDQDARVKRLIIAFAVIMTVPSGFFFVHVLRNLRFENSIKTFLNEKLRTDQSQPLRWEVTTKGDTKVLKVYSVGRAFTAPEKEALRSAMPTFGLTGLDLKIIQLNTSPEQLGELNTKESSVSQKLDLIQSIEETRQNEVDDLKQQLAELRASTDPKLIFLREIKTNYPEVLDATWQTPADGSNGISRDLLAIEFNPDVKDADKRSVLAHIVTDVRFKFGKTPVDVAEVTRQVPAATPTPANPVK